MRSERGSGPRRAASPRPAPASCRRTARSAAARAPRRARPAQRASRGRARTRRPRRRWPPAAVDRRRCGAQRPARRPRPDDRRELFDGLLDHRSVLSVRALGARASPPRALRRFPASRSPCAAFSRSASARSSPPTQRRVLARRAGRPACARAACVERLQRARRRAACATSVRCDVYRPSRRSNAPISPGRVHASASRTIRSLYSAVNRPPLGAARPARGPGPRDQGPPSARRARRPQSPARLRLPGLRGRRQPHSRALLHPYSTPTSPAVSVLALKVSNSSMVSVSPDVDREGTRTGAFRVATRPASRRSSSAVTGRSACGSRRFTPSRACSSSPMMIVRDSQRRFSPHTSTATTTPVHRSRSAAG